MPSPTGTVQKDPDGRCGVLAKTLEHLKGWLDRFFVYLYPYDGDNTSVEVPPQLIVIHLTTSM
jgi:hypothetical protein